MQEEAVGVFPEFINRRAFIDRVVVNVQTAQKPSADIPGVTRNVGIKSETSCYARLLEFECAGTGNRAQLNYGKVYRTNWVHKLAPCRMSIKADVSPVTCAQVEHSISLAVPAATSRKVALVEVTFDTDVSIDEARRFLVTRARRIRCMKNTETGLRTLYVGSPKSPTQVRVYQKTPRVTRFEFILRPHALRRLGVTKPCDLLKLQTADLWKFVRWQEYEPVQLLLLIGNRIPSDRHRVALTLLRRNPVLFKRCLRQVCAARERLLLRDAQLQHRLLEMQTRLTW